MSVELSKCIALFFRARIIHKNANTFYLPWALGNNCSFAKILYILLYGNAMKIQPH